MKEKIIALVFGLLTLALEVLVSIKNPTVESLTATVFSLVIVIAVIALMRRTVTLTEEKPVNGKRPLDKVLKLSDKIAPYIKEKDGKITLKIER